MAPFAKGFVRPRSRKMRALISVGESVAPPDPRRRPLPSLLDPPPVAAPLKKGIPQLELQFDTLNTIVTGFRKYQPPPEKLPPLRREYTEKNFNELFAKYNGDKLRDEILRIAKDLHIVGWVKCRSNFASGHGGGRCEAHFLSFKVLALPIWCVQLQGDTFALSYFRRWLDRHAPYAIDSTNFFDEAIGLQALDYQQIAAVNDYRSPAKKKLHMLMVKV
ncbi:hypothetical protein cyc_02862 [Cyclospora cayetanensis]|uniref:Uncharacterized protein n=1 Tax=Cyclospora cayetanensis TaxID=88456 RepID=A0A1D3D6F8_9EIME|nr:hypothetical protein cyc_02862 [Cyclospora cayetanensis]